MPFLSALRTPKQFLLRSLFVAALVGLSACGSKDDGASPVPGAHPDGGCQPAEKNQSLSDSVTAQCDQGQANPPIFVPNLPPPPGLNTGRECTTDHFTQTGSVSAKKMDVLFVMDTSYGTRWYELAEHLRRFTDQLEGVDLRFSVILAHVDEQDGRLWAPAGEPKVLDIRRMSVKEIQYHLEQTFFYGSLNFDDRGLGEAGFYSLHKLMTKHADEAKKLGFLRSDAGLLVLFQSFEQEIGSPAPHHPPHGILPRCDSYYPPIIKKHFYDAEHVSIDSTFAAVRAIKGDMPVSMNAFVNVDREDMDHYIPFPQLQPGGGWCVYASPGYGYFDMVAKTGGVLRSVHEDLDRSLDRLGKAAHDGLVLQHDFPLSHPAKEVDPTSIRSVVDNGLTPHTYSAASDMVHLEYAGKIGSKIDINYCMPLPTSGWSITGFAGTTTQTTASLSWKTTGENTSGKIMWGTSAGSLTQTAADTATGQTHGVTVSGLTPNTTYYFQAVSTDDYGTQKMSAVIALTTQPIPLPTWSISGFAGTATETAVALSFDTSQYATTGHVLWGTSSNALSNSTVSDASPVTNHAFTVTGLTPNTTYYFQASATDDQGQTHASAVIAVTTQPVPLPTWSITNFAGSSTETTVALAFITAQDATTGQILWGTSATGLTNATVADSSAETSHAYTVSGLTPNTTYYFQASATDSTGQTQKSAVIAVTTQPVPLPAWTLTNFAGTAGETSATLTFSTSQYATVGTIFWGTSPSSLSNASAPEAAAVTSHSITVSGLSPNTTYYFQASATDDHSQTQTSSVIAITTQPIPLPVWTITNFAGTSTTTTATLSFNTSQYATTGHVIWGTSSDNLNQTTTADTSAVTTHSFTVTGLTANTTYYFQAVATDNDGQSQNSAVISVTTQPNPLPVWTLTNFAGTSTTTTATLTFNTAQYATTGVVTWGTSASSLTNSTTPDSTPVTAHTFTVTGLTPNTTYYFQAAATDDQGQTQTSAVISVTTQPNPLPVWTITNFAGTSTTTSATLTFSTSQYATTGEVLWGTASGSLTNTTPADASAVTAHSFTVTGLTPNTTYYFQASATDNDGQTQTSTVIVVKTQPIPLPVWTLTNFAGTSTTTTATLTFSTAQYATTGVVTWGTSSGNLTNGTTPDASPVTAHSFTVTGLTPNTTYYFQASATDDQGQSQQSAVIAVTTQPNPLPVWTITNFAGTTTTTTATLSFNTSQYATTGEVLWGTSPGSLTNTTAADSSAVTSHTFTVTGLSPSTTYYFQAAATDDKGQTQTSTVISLTTAAASTWSIVGFDGTTTDTTVALIWQTGSVPTNGVVLVGTSPTNLTLQTVSAPNFATSQTVLVSGLSASTTYYFQVTATDQNGISQTSGVISKTTKASRSNHR